MVTFNDLVRSLENLGALDVLIPFFLIFTVAFAILEKTRILGNHKKNLNVALAFILGLGVVIPHVIAPGGPADVVNIINSALPQISVVVVALVSLFLLIGLFAPEVRWPGGGVGAGIVIIALLIVIFVFGNSAGWWFTPTWLNWFSPDTQAFVIILIVFVLVVSFIIHEPGEHRGNGISGFFDAIGNMFGRR